MEESKMRYHKSCKFFITFFVGLLAFFPVFNDAKLPFVKAQEAITPVAEAVACDDGTGWMWTRGPDQPETARQVEQALSKEGIVSTVAATGFGEKDSCGNFKQYATDFALKVEGNAMQSSVEQQALNDKMLSTLSRFAIPRLGNVRIDSESGGSQFYPGSPSSFSASSIPAAPLSGDSVLDKKVYLLVYDPILSNGQHLSQYMGWYSYETLATGIIGFMQNASQGQVQYSIAYTSVVTDEWPVKIDGFRYTEQTYLKVMQNQMSPHDPDTVDYDIIIDNPEFDLCGKLNRGEIDELWMYAGPWFGFYESRLVGPDAYLFNSPPVSGTHNCSGLLPIMGLNYERGLPEAVESFGHRTEATMEKAYGSWEENRTAHNWDRFGLVKAQSPNYSYSGCGSIHYPPNGTTDYDYGNPNPTLSNCDDFQNYPNLHAPLAVAQPITCTVWNCNQIDYFMYWYSHFPSVAGCTDAIGNNWWQYFADPDLALAPSSACPSFTLTVNKTGAGSGTITSNPAGINCGADCSETYARTTPVTLTAQPAAGFIFEGWGGGCSGTAPGDPCKLTMLADISVTAAFVKPCSNCGPANSAWPLYRQNTLRTGRSSLTGPANPGLLWLYDGHSYDGSSSAIGPDGTIYVGLSNKLFAFQPDGSVNWSYTMGGLARSPAIAANGTVYAGADDGKLYAFNSKGTLKWTFTTDSWISDSPALSPDGIVYFGSSDGNFYAVRPDGTQKWSYTIGHWQNPSPAVGPDGTIYQASTNFNVYALTSGGQLKWQYPTGNYIDASPALGPDGTIYVGSLDHYLYALNSAGTLKWRYLTGNEVGSPAIGADGTVYAGSRDNYLYAINPNGTLKWKYLIGDFVHNPSVDSNGTIYVGSNDSYLYAFHPSGTLKWRILLGGLLESDPVIGSDHNIYITSGGTLYAIGNCYTLTLTATPEPGGNITADPPPNCNNGTAYRQDTKVSLTTYANPGYVFSGWSGVCSGNDSCIVSITGNKSVNANFTATNIDVLIGTTRKESYYVPDHESMRQSYVSVNQGPLKIQNTEDKNIVASQKVLYGSSYSEMMGLPFEQLSKEYLFPYYNNVAMDSQLRVSNVGGADTTITVYLGTTQIDSYTLAAGGASRKNYTGKNSGPLRVTSSASNILATTRVLYNSNSYSELMGLPAEQLAKEYLFPYYNNVAMDSQLRVSNVGGSDTTITVYLGTTQIDSYTLKAGGATRKNYTGRNSGPLRVTSSASNILTTIRVLYGGSSYSELMGFPTGHLEQEYWYPVYDDVSVDSQLRVSNVGSATTHITVYAGTEEIDSYDLGKGAATRKNYPKNTGPLHVVSSTQPILTTVRTLCAGNSYYEMTGLPNGQHSTQYFFPWYNNKAMDSELRIAIP
jgi:outer membrane protein assembly factor BamB